jgi:hypothetical protein
MTYTVTYTVKGYMAVFTDVVEVSDINECEAAVQKLVDESVGHKPVSIILIKEK